VGIPVCGFSDVQHSPRGVTDVLQCLAVDAKHGENQFDIEEFIQ
jgi:hypothetical protein